MERAAAVDRLEAILDTIEAEPMPVPVREVWALGDVALGLDPIERLDVYLAKDVLMRGDDPDAAATFEASHGVKGVGRTVRAAWARRFPEHLRATAAGYAAPERCLAAHLLPADEPVHLEVCNSGFEDNVTQRLRGARARGAWDEVLDPRGVCLWLEGRRSGTALGKLREGSFVFPTLAEALGMLGLDGEEASRAADAVRGSRRGQAGPSVRGDVV